MSGTDDQDLLTRFIAEELNPYVLELIDGVVAGTPRLGVLELNCFDIHVDLDRREVRIIDVLDATVPEAVVPLDEFLARVAA